jgi:hypothetical protein
VIVTRRWVVFTPSIVSALDNPGAHLYRALGKHLVDDRFDATFFEQRANRWLHELLMTEGAAGLRAFREQFPDIEYRTYELRSGPELVEWLTRVLSTADVALVDRLVPEPIVKWVGQLTRYHLQTFLIDLGVRDRISESLEEDLASYSAICTLYEEQAAIYREVSLNDRVILARAGLMTEGSRDTIRWRDLAADLARQVSEVAIGERKRFGRA